MGRFDGKVVIVTGSSAGIGRDAVLGFAKEGASVVLHGQSLERLQETEDLILKAGTPKEKVLIVQGPIEQEESQRKIIDETVKKFGKIDVLVNNAGTILKPGVTDVEALENYDYIFSINLRAVIAMTKLAVPHLEKTHGSIVNVSSVGSARMLPHAVYYACTKAALDHYTRHCALQYGAKGIRVNSINPGPVETYIYDRHNDSDDARVALEDWVSNATIMKRYGKCNEMTPIILLLASDEASYVTGANWLIDGGYTANMKPVEFAAS